MDFEKLRELPQDILNVISHDIPEITTLLSKKHRDQYFKKHGIFINLNERHRPLSELLYIYDVTIIYSNFRKDDIWWLKSLKNTNNIKKMHAVYAYYLDNILYYCNNIQYIYGSVALSGCSSLKHIKNDVLIVIIGMNDLERYLYMGLKNKLVVVSDSRDRTDVANTYNKVGKIPSYMLIDNYVYSNISLIYITDLEEFLKKNVIVPNIKKMYIVEHTSGDSIVLLHKKYPQVSIYLTRLCYENWDITDYHKCKDITLNLVVYDENGSGKSKKIDTRELFGYENYNIQSVKYSDTK